MAAWPSRLRCCFTAKSGLFINTTTQGISSIAIAVSTSLVNIQAVSQTKSTTLMTSSQALVLAITSSSVKTTA